MTVHRLLLDSICFALTSVVLALGTAMATAPEDGGWTEGAEFEALYAKWRGWNLRPPVPPTWKQLTVGRRVPSWASWTHIMEWAVPAQNSSVGQGKSAVKTARFNLRFRKAFSLEELSTEGVCNVDV